MRYALAIDIGASSGRHILGHMEGGKLITEEIYRFENGIREENGARVWDVEALFAAVLEGLRACASAGKIPETVAIDTWGVDYVLLDENKKEILPVYSYRDGRTERVMEEVEALLPPAELYARCGIQKLSFNTIYQLYADKKAGRLERAAHLLMIPAYLSYRLTGVLQNEYTNCTTTAMVGAEEKRLDPVIFETLGISASLFGEVSAPGASLGNFTKEIEKTVGFSANVLFCPSHDTASAVAACPLSEGDIYISSGTWSLIGMELSSPVLTEEARRANFTNEGGIDYRFRFLKNYMGMWLFQNIRKNVNKTKTYDEMMEEARAAEKYEYIDVNAPEFVAPENMIEAIRTYLKRPDMPLGEVINSVYHSLAKSYRDAFLELEKITGVKSESIRIMGGGSRDTYLNTLTARYTGKKVFAGPVEATAIGNLISQMYAQGGYTLEELRNIVKHSFGMEEVTK